MIPDSYQTIASFIRCEIKVMNSRFLASAFPVSSKEEAEAFLKQLRKQFYDANHNCFAYRIGLMGGVFRYSDDGEPSGTAGIKIFNAIQTKNLFDILIVVTRYFGGTKLGVGGLSRAYFDSALSVLEKVEIIEKVLTGEVKIKFSYDLTSRVMHTLSNYNAKIIETIYGDDVVIKLMIRNSLIDNFKLDIVNDSSGSVNLISA